MKNPLKEIRLNFNVEYPRSQSERYSIYISAISANAHSNIRFTAYLAVRNL